MKRYFLLTVFLLLCCGAYGQLTFAPSCNVELMGIVHNIASGYTVGADGFTREETPVFSGIYAAHGNDIAQHDAVKYMKRLIDSGSIDENEFFEIAILYDEFDFSKPGNSYALPGKFYDEERNLLDKDLALLLHAMQDLAGEEYIKTYFRDEYLRDYCLTAENSESKSDDIKFIYITLLRELNERLNPHVRVVPAIHIEPFVGYGSLLRDRRQEEKAVLFFGLSLSHDNKTTFGYDVNMFTHELLHPVVTRAMESARHAEEGELLECLFKAPGVKEAAERTKDYADSRSYFNETFTRALEIYCYRNFLGAAEYAHIIEEANRADFIFLTPSVEILQTKFHLTDISFYDFYSELVRNLWNSEGSTAMSGQLEISAQ